MLWVYLTKDWNVQTLRLELLQTTTQEKFTTKILYVF